MLTIVFRTFIIYIILLLIMRLMGKRQIGELEVTDLVTTLLISEIGSLPITNQDIPVSYAVIPMIILLTLEVVFSVVLIRLPKLKNLVSARPTVIIQNGRLDQNALKNLRISIDELMSEVRQSGIPDLSQVDSAIVEKNGKLTVLAKALYSPPTAKELGLSPKEEGMMHIVYSNGGCSKVGLSLIGKDEGWLKKEFGRRGAMPDSLFCVTANSMGKLYFIFKEDTDR